MNIRKITDCRIWTLLGLKKKQPLKDGDSTPCFVYSPHRLWFINMTRMQGISPANANFQK